MLDDAFGLLVDGLVDAWSFNMMAPRARRKAFVKKAATWLYLAVQALHIFERFLRH